MLVHSCIHALGTSCFCTHHRRVHCHFELDPPLNFIKYYNVRFGSFCLFKQYHNDKTVLFKQCHSERTVLLKQCRSERTVLFKQCDCERTVLFKQCHSGRTVLFKQCHSETTVLFKQCHSKRTVCNRKQTQFSLFMEPSLYTCPLCTH